MPLSYSLFFFYLIFFWVVFAFFHETYLFSISLPFVWSNILFSLKKTKNKKQKQNKRSKTKTFKKLFFSSLAKPLKMLKVVAIFQTEFQTKAKTRSVLRASIINFQFTAQLKIRLSKETYMQTC